MVIASEPSHRFNKAGRLVLREACRKYYEAHSEQHALFLEALHAESRLAALLPPLLGRHGVFVEAGWVEARRWPAPAPAELAALLQRFQGVPVAGLPASGFDYWLDFVRPRFRKAAQLLGQLEPAEQLLERCDLWLADQPLAVQHPDLTAANVVRARPAGLVVIDNELCCLGRSPLLDVCNALHPLSPRARRLWLTAFWPEGAPPSLRCQWPLLSDAWTARRVGGLVVAGRLREARHWLEQQRSGVLQLPFDPAWL